MRTKSRAELRYGIWLPVASWTKTTSLEGGKKIEIFRMIITYTLPAAGCWPGMPELMFPSPGPMFGREIAKVDTE